MLNNERRLTVINKIRYLLLRFAGSGNINFFLNLSMKDKKQKWHRLLHYCCQHLSFFHVVSLLYSSLQKASGSNKKILTIFSLCPLWKFFIFSQYFNLFIEISNSLKCRISWYIFQSCHLSKWFSLTFCYVFHFSDFFYFSSLYSLKTLKD